MGQHRLARLLCGWLIVSFTSAAAAQPALQQSLPVPPASGAAVPPLQTGVIGVPYLQAITLAVPDVSRVLSVDPSIIEATVVSPGVVQLRALAFGQTFVHFWTPSLRQTRAVETTEPPVAKPAPTTTARRSAQDVARDLTFEYQNRYRHQRRGPKWSQTDLNTLTQFTHELTGQMDTPHGRATGRVDFQRINSQSELSSWNAGLQDGDIGWLKRFDVFGGDVGAGYSDLTLPQGTIRGIEADYRDWVPYKLDAFYGQRRLGFATGLSPSAQQNNDVFFSGGRFRYDAKPAELALMYAGASGTDRADIQTSQAMAAEGWYWLNEAWKVGGEVGRTQENAYGYRLKSAYREGQVSLDTTYRNFSQRYENLLGRSAEQGERGVLVNASEVPWSKLTLRQRVDWYDDTLFRNPAEPQRSNLEAELSGDLDITSATSLSGGFSRERLLGRLFPTDTTTLRSGLRHRIGIFPLLSGGSWFTDYQYRKLRSVSSPSSDFRSHEFIVGLSAPLTDFLSWQVSQEWILLKDTLSGNTSVPRETSAGVNYAQQLRWLPVFLHSGLHYSTTSSAESANSFLINEDRWTWDSGARYTFSPDAEAFVETRLLRTRRAITGKEVEFEVETGVRYFLDTHIRWEPSLSLSGIVFEDLNGDGLQQSGEAGLPHIGVVAGGQAPAVTDSGGRFYFGRVRGQRVEVGVDIGSLPEGYVATTPARQEINLLRPPALPLLFGFVAQSELRVRVFVDAQGNGQYDATDVPLERVHVSIDDGTVRLTDRSGWAFFRGIRPGSYQVKLNVNDLAAGYVPSGETLFSATLPQGKAVLVDFPILAQRSIGGRVYVDRNRDAHFDEEPVLQGIPVCLDGLRRTATLEGGRYLFKEVSAGLHRIWVNCGQPVTGLLPLSATVQTLELPPQPVDRDDVDFRFGEKDVIMQDIIADVQRSRLEQQKLVDEMIQQRRSGQKR